MIKLLNIAIVILNVAAYTSKELSYIDYPYQMVGFLAGLFQTRLDFNSVDELSCLKYAVDETKFGTNYDLVMKHIKDNADHFQWDSREIGFNIHEMMEGLFNGMRTHDGEPACKSSNSTIQNLVDAYSLMSKEFTKLKYNNQIPKIEDLRCSDSWWMTDTQTILYGEQIFYNYESQSVTNDELVVQVKSFINAGKVMRRFLHSVLDVNKNGYSYGSAYNNNCPANPYKAQARLLAESADEVPKKLNHFDCKLCMDKKDLLKVFDGFYDGQSRLNVDLPIGFNVLHCVDETQKLEQFLDGTFEDLQESLDIYEENRNHKLGAKYFYLIDAVIEEVMSSSKCPELKQALSFSTSKHDQIYMPELKDTTNDGFYDEWLFTTNDGQNIDLMPILKLIGKHHESYEQEKLSDKDDAHEHQYRIGYLMGMFDSAVDLHGQKKEKTWAYWLLGSGAVVATLIASIYIYMRHKRNSIKLLDYKKRDSQNVKFSVDTIQPING